MAVSYVTLYLPDGTPVQVVEGGPLHKLYVARGANGAPPTPGPVVRLDPFPQYVDQDELTQALGGVGASDTAVAALVNDTGSQTRGALGAAFVRMAPPPSGGDDRAALQAAVAGGGIVLLHSGTYLIATKGGFTADARSTKHCLELPNGTALIGQGKGITIIKAADTLAPDSPLLLAFDPTDLEIANLTIDGNKQRLSAANRGVSEDEGINFKGTCTRVNLRDLHIHDTGQDCIDFDFAQGSVDVFVDNCLLENAGGLGIHNGTERIIVSRTTIRGCCFDRSGQAVEPWGGIDLVHSNAVLTDCVIEDNAKYLVDIDGAVGNVADIQVRGCKIGASGNTRAVLLQNAPVRPVVAGNSISGTEMTAILGNTAVGPIIRDNTIVSTAVAAGNQCISIGGSGGKIRGNRCKGGHRSITINGSDHEVSGNTVENSVSANLEMTFGSATNCLVANNVFLGTPPDKSIIAGPNGHHFVGNSIANGVAGLTGNTFLANRGLKTEATGIATIPDGAATVLVSHGLGGTNVQVTPNSFGLTPMATVAAPLWVSTRSQNTFTISRSGTTGPLDVAWNASTVL